MSPAERERIGAMCRLLTTEGHMTEAGLTQLMNLADHMVIEHGGVDGDELADQVRMAAMGYEDEQGNYHQGAVNFWDDDVDEHAMAKHLHRWLATQGEVRT